MTNQQGAPEALRLAAEVLDWMPTSDTQRALWDRHQEALAVVKAALVDARQPAAHVQNPAVIEHVAGDVSKNDGGSNMAQQPAQSAAAASKAVLAAIRAANMQLVRTGDDEFMLVTYKNAEAQCDGGQCGIGGYCDDCPTPQADSQPAPAAAFEVADAMADSQYLAGVSAGWNAANAGDPNAALQKLHESRAGYLKPLSAARAPADSVTAPAGGTNTKTAELLSTTVGLLMGYREGGARQPYKPGSVVAKVIDEVVDHLKDWPYPEPSPTPQADSAPLAAPADIVVLEAALRAIHQAIDLIGEPDTERLRTVRRVLRGAVVVAEDSTAPQADSQPAPVLDRDRIREIFMAHGFTVKEGQTDLKQYVYDAADALLRAARAPADSVLEDAECWRLIVARLDEPNIDTVAHIRNIIECRNHAARKQGGAT